MSDGPRTIDIGQFKPPAKPPNSVLVAIAVGVLAVILIFNSVYQVEPEEVGVVLRFGKYTREAQPGLNFKLPTPIETVQKVPVQRQLKEEFGFRTQEAGVRTTYSSERRLDESLMLTGDLNVIVAEWTTQYRVRSPYEFLFRVRNVQKTFRDMNEAIMRSVVGDRSVNEVLTVGRQEVASEVERQLQILCDQYETGIVVEQVVLQDVNPPEPVKPSFNEVNQAEQERERAINEARAQYNRVIPKARGEAEQVVQQAEGYAIDRVNRAKGDVVLFKELYASYRRAPEVTRRRIYLETMLEVMPKVERKVILDDKLEGVLPLLSLERMQATPGGGQ